MTRQRRHIRRSKYGRRFVAGRRPKLYQFEIEFSGGTEEDQSEYGFGTNPPLVVNAPSKIDAVRQLDRQYMRDKGVKIRSIVG